MPLNMDMSDERWQSLREAARRFLKADGCVLQVSIDNVTDAHKVVQAIADNIPSKINLPTIIEGELGVDGLFRIGGDEPSLKSCWVPGGTYEEFEEQVFDLLEAGYPGCVGCAGPGAEGVWDEKSRRANFST
jgi:hypothetical protein